MQSQILPKLHTIQETRKYGQFQLRPLMRGYGTTLGVSLRRVLLSSLRGTAVTSIRIQDIYHEFASIPHVREDTTQLILNIRELALHSHSPRPVTLTLHVQGAGIYTAGDISENPNVEILNPELYLLTADSDTDLEIELVVECGYGYSPQEERNATLASNLPIDAVFSPIVRASYRVEDHRIGQQTDLDQVTLEVWTDGSVSPLNAMQEASRILVNHLRVVMLGSDEEETAPAEVVEDVPDAKLQHSIEDLDLNVRTYNCLKRVGIATLGELFVLMEKGRDEMLAIRNFGQKSLDELMAQLKKKDLLHIPGTHLEEYLEREEFAEDGSSVTKELEGEELDPVQSDVPTGPVSARSGLEAN